MKKLLLIWLLVFAFPASAHASSLGKDALRKIGIDQKIGDHVPMDLQFELNGERTTLDALTGDKPIIVALVYNRCPMLCDQLLQGLLSSLKVLKLDAGSDFDVLAVSFDPDEDPATTADARSEFLRRYARPNADAGVHFLTGNPPEIAAFTDAVGFRYTYDEVSKEYAHASAIMVLTPEGKIARYFFGSEFSPRDIRLALREASDGNVGDITDDLLLLCYQYDPQNGTYSATIVNAIRFGGVATVLALALFIGRNLRRREEAPE